MDKCINERIKKVRAHAELTQQQFADRIKVKRNTVATYEMGRSVPSDAAIALICKEFHVSEKWLRDGAGEPYALPDDPDAEIIEDILFDVDNPVYKVALDVLRVYKKLEPDYKALLEEFAKQLCEEMKKDREN